MNDLITITSLTNKFNDTNGEVKEKSGEDYYDILTNQMFMDIYLKSGRVIRIGRYAKKVQAELTAACIDTIEKISNGLLIIRKKRLFLGMNNKTSTEVIKQSHISHISDCNGHIYHIICEKDFI